MRIIIAGSRHLNRHYHDVLTALHGAILEWGITEITEIVTGGAKGIDAEGKRLAESFGIAHREFPADWNTHGKAAGPIRNAEMADYADALVLVWDGRSMGSANMKKEAEKRGLKVHERLV